MIIAIMDNIGNTKVMFLNCKLKISTTIAAINEIKMKKLIIRLRKKKAWGLKKKPKMLINNTNSIIKNIKFLLFEIILKKTKIDNRNEGTKTETISVLLI